LLLFCFGAADRFKSNNYLDLPITNYALRNDGSLAAGPEDRPCSAVSSQQRSPIAGIADTLTLRSDNTPAAGCELPRDNGSHALAFCRALVILLNYTVSQKKNTSLKAVQQLAIFRRNAIKNTVAGSWVNCESHCQLSPENVFK